MEQDASLKSMAAQQSPIGSDGYSVFLPQDVRTNLAAYRGGDVVAGNNLFQNLYRTNQGEALSLVDNNTINHDGMMGAFNRSYNINDKGYIDTGNKAADEAKMLNMLENKKNGADMAQQQQQQQQAGGAVPQHDSNLPGSQTDSSLRILQRR